MSWQRMLLLAAALTLGAVSGAAAQPASRAGGFQSVESRPLSATFGEFMAATLDRAPAELHVAIRRDLRERDWIAIRSGEVAVTEGTYEVDGLRIRAVVVAPNRNGPHPVLIWARGGIGLVEISEAQRVEMAWWAGRGYVVIASAYRGPASGVGRDEFGGADVRDIQALQPLIASFGGDPRRVFALGFSRGSVMLFRAVAEGLPVRSFATVGGITDVASLNEGNDRLRTTFGEMMPDYEAEVLNGFCRRSARCWPERIGVPVLLVHGAADGVVPSSQSSSFARQLAAASTPHQLLLVDGGDHSLTGHRLSVFEAADAYFRRYDVPSPPAPAGGP